MFPQYLFPYCRETESYTKPRHTTLRMLDKYKKQTSLSTFYLLPPPNFAWKISNKSGNKHKQWHLERGAKTKDKTITHVKCHQIYVRQYNNKYREALHPIYIIDTIFHKKLFYCLPKILSKWNTFNICSNIGGKNRHDTPMATTSQKFECQNFPNIIKHSVSINQ